MKIPSVLFNDRSVSKDEAWVIFRAGFLASGEGWNGEYPFEGYWHSQDEADKDTAYLYSQFEEWLNSGE